MLPPSAWLVCPAKSLPSHPLLVGIQMSVLLAPRSQIQTWRPSQLKRSPKREEQWVLQLGFSGELGTESSWHRSGCRQGSEAGAGLGHHWVPKSPCAVLNERPGVRRTRAAAPTATRPGGVCGALCSGLEPSPGERIPCPQSLSGVLLTGRVSGRT